MRAVSGSKQWSRSGGRAVDGGAFSSVERAGERMAAEMCCTSRRRRLGCWHGKKDVRAVQHPRNFSRKVMASRGQTPSLIGIGAGENESVQGPHPGSECFQPPLPRSLAGL